MLPSKTFSFGIYPQGTSGYDISFPQCHLPYPSKPYAFGIVGVNEGKAFNQNSCLLDEVLWARFASTEASLYMNLNYPSGKTAIFGMSGPAGNCSKGNKSCQAYNYGYKAAQYAYQYTSLLFVTANIWWFDIETANTWSDNTSLNNKVLQGAIDFFNTENVQTGIYSTRNDWTTIMGKTFIPIQDFITPIPNWVGGGTEATALLLCLQPFTANGQVWLVQYDNGSFDGDYVCP